jgi:uncharacterized protein (DUF2141 family)
MKQAFIFVLLIAIGLPLGTYAEEIQVNIKGIRNLKGIIRIGVFKDNEVLKMKILIRQLKLKKEVYLKEV